MSHFTPSKRGGLRRHALRSLGIPEYPDLPQMVRDALLARTDLEYLAAERSAEHCVATRESWARGGVAIFADGSRQAFRDPEQIQRETWRRLGRRFRDGDAGPEAAK